MNARLPIYQYSSTPSSFVITRSVSGAIHPAKRISTCSREIKWSFSPCKPSQTKDGEEGGFTATFTLSSDLKPGTYRVCCVAEDGHTEAADLIIPTNANPMPPMEASTEPLVLDRSKSPLLIGSVTILALLSVGLGVWLVRVREQSNR